MGRLATRLQRLEALVPTALFMEMWLRIMREAAVVVALDNDTTETLLAAMLCHHQALQLPPLMEADLFARVAQALTDGAMAAITAHVPAAQQYPFRKAASDRCLVEARRYEVQEEERW